MSLLISGAITRSPRGISGFTNRSNPYLTNLSRRSAGVLQLLRLQGEKEVFLHALADLIIQAGRIQLPLQRRKELEQSNKKMRN
jgi:hypothetical protein